MLTAMNRSRCGVVTRVMKKLSYRGPTLETLHQEYAKRHKIDEHAPVQAHAEVTIEAPVARVWQKLSDVSSWRTNLEPNVRDIRLADGVRVDGEFRRRLNGAGVRARFAVVDARRELSWSGTSLGVHVVHRFTLEPVGPDRTHVLVEESMAGRPVIAVITAKGLTRTLQQSLETLRDASQAGDAKAVSIRGA